MIRAVHVPLDEVPWHELATATDRTIGQTRGWLAFLAASQGATPVAAQLRAGTEGEVVGWATAAVVRRGGIRQLGSPLPGWTTSAMGFNLRDDIDRLEAAIALRDLAFHDLGCWHLELADRSLGAVAPPPGFTSSPLRSFEVELRDDDALLAAMTANGRRNVRKAERLGTTVEEVDPLDPGSFATEYHRHLAAAFAARGQVPTYPQERVEQLIEHVGAEGGLLLLRARTDDGELAATAIFAGVPGGVAEFVGGAARRDLHPRCPNEAIMWAAMQRWRARGARALDLGGGGEHKRKYGGVPTERAWLRASRVAVLEHGRRLAVSARRRWRHRN